jgi:hypothetical protein
VKFISKEKLCMVREYSAFDGNETHICKTKLYIPFNGTMIPCCGEIGVNNTSPDVLPPFGIDCNKDWSSFVDASETCSPFNIICNSTIDLFGTGGVLQNISKYYEIKGLNNEKCTFYFKYNSLIIYYSEESIQNALSQGTTQEEINQDLETINSDYSYLIGMNSTCYYPVSDLTSMISGWDEAYFSGLPGDVEMYNCIGSIYE